ncbi:MAG: 2-amino-4-hydroxy-6-hydroxymethyldihydropteridine diphosphokinase [Candidatus Hydrogenedentes bacterium]|nr:2-amino-4-hydroxy-6-hydroxymethyldihydropteridine diphosphokinase [Candidatus Hydrogenedentota bacterium]
MRERSVLQRVFISIGSNIEPESNIVKGLGLLSSYVTINAVSTVFRTDPIGPGGGPPFLNGVFAITTQTGPRALKYRVLRSIEDRLGRIRTDDRYAPRVIDLDILLYENEMIDEPGLKIPDPDLADRPFLIEALLEIEPGLVLPGTQAPLAMLLPESEARSYTPEHEFTTQLRQRLAQ